MCKYLSRHGLSIGMLSVAALLSVSAVPAMQDGAPPRPGGRGMPVNPEQERPRQPGQAGPMAMISFHDHMENAGRSFRGLGRAMRGAGAAEAADPAMLWRSLDMLQVSLAGAKSRIEEVEMSEAAKAKFGEDRKAYHQAIRVELHTVIKESLALEEALIKGDTAAAEQSARKLGDLQRDAHTLFQPKEEGDEQPGDGQRPRRPGGRGGQGGAGGGAGGGQGGQGGGGGGGQGGQGGAGGGL